MMRNACYAAALVAFAAWAQTPPQPKSLTARELFYAAVSQPAPKVTAEPKLTPPAATQAPAAKAKAGHRPAARKKTPAAAPEPDPEISSTPRERSTVPDPGPGFIKPAAYGAERSSLPPLGLRYTLLKLVDGRMQEIAPDTTFRAGDRIQLSVEVNDAGYLYIINQGSSGTWKPMFPSAEIEDGNNRVNRGRTYILPPGSRFYFDEQPGEERLFVIFSREPEQDIEGLIYSLKGGQAEPVSRPAAPHPPQRILVASNNMPGISDALVGRLRNVYARDLVIEKVDEDTPGPRREKAVYVVNPTGSPDSRVVADIRLTHR
ncbi:MAG: DUF4384 domain-containing protein [Bryobacteraceae bacterium]